MSGNKMQTLYRQCSILIYRETIPTGYSNATLLYYASKQYTNTTVLYNLGKQY